MIIMTFNILNGGFDDTSSRIEHIVSVINGVKPDFLALQEANHFDKNDNALLKRISDETELPHYALSQGSLDEKGERYHVASLSRYPLRSVYAFPSSSFQSAALSVVISSPVGELSLCNVHLNSSSGNSRVKEIKEVLSHQSRFENNIILGDCNTLDPDAWHLIEERGNPKSEEFVRYDLANCKVTDVLTEEGYVDAAKYLGVEDRTSHPTPGCPHSICTTPVGLDYFWVEERLRSSLKESAFVRTPTAQKASDHYPATLTLS